MTTPDLIDQFRRSMLCVELQDGPTRDVTRLLMMMLAAVHKGGFVSLGLRWGWPDALERPEFA